MSEIKESRSQTILIVEDDQLVREHLRNQLVLMGYSVISAVDGRTAIKALRAQRAIDLLFTDLVMPGGMTGKELADVAQTMRPALKVLFTSGYAGGGLLHEGRLDPSVELLSKPYRREQLVAKLRKVLGDPR